MGSGAQLGVSGLIVLLAVLPVPGEEFVDPFLRGSGDMGQDIGEPGLRFDIIELGSADERAHRRRAHAAIDMVVSPMAPCRHLGAVDMGGR